MLKLIKINETVTSKYFVVLLLRIPDFLFFQIPQRLVCVINGNYNYVKLGPKRISGETRIKMLNK